MLLKANNSPSTERRDSSRLLTRKASLLKSIQPPSRRAEIPYRKKSMTGTGTPLSSKGFAKRGLVPYEIPAMMPAQYPIKRFFFISRSVGISLAINGVQRYKILSLSLLHALPPLPPAPENTLMVYGDSLQPHTVHHDTLRCHETPS